MNDLPDVKPMASPDSATGPVPALPPNGPLPTRETLVKRLAALGLTVNNAGPQIPEAVLDMLVRSLQAQLLEADVNQRAGRTGGDPAEGVQVFHDLQRAFRDLEAEGKRRAEMLGADDVGQAVLRDEKRAAAGAVKFADKPKPRLVSKDRMARLLADDPAFNGPFAKRRPTGSDS